jgi:hypothetical protein
MGLRPLEAGSWLEVDGNRGRELSAKHELLDSPETHSRVVAALPETELEGRRLLDLVVDDLGRFHPGLVTVTDRGDLRDTTTGYTVATDRLHPVDAAGRLVQEDLCLMSRMDGRWVLSAASVCFPSRWCLADKIGRDLSAIHRPVPGYEESLAQPTEGFFDRLTPEKPVWRLNWTMLTDPALHQPDPEARLAKAGTSRPDPGGPIWFRVERQTLRRISEQSVSFTIRTYVTPLGDLLERDPQLGPALRVALTDLPSDVLAYKGWGAIAPALLSSLARRDPNPRGGA